jgi:hypothetical protein
MKHALRRAASNKYFRITGSLQRSRFIPRSFFRMAAITSCVTALPDIVKAFLTLFGANIQCAIHFLDVSLQDPKKNNTSATLSLALALYG